MIGRLCGATLSSGKRFLSTGCGLRTLAGMPVGIIVLITNLVILLTLFSIRQNLGILSPSTGSTARTFHNLPGLFADHAPCPALNQNPTVNAYGIPAGEPIYLHYVRFKPDDKINITLRFIDYLSVVSAVQRFKPDAIFLHGDVEPVGYYWQKLKSQNWISHRMRNKTTTLPGRIKKPEHIWHMSDIAKLDILMEYGGVSVDFDVYFVRGNRIKDILAKHDALTCFGDTDGANAGLMGFHKTSRLLAAWRRSYDVIYTTGWNFNPGDVQKYLSEIFAEEVYVINYVCNHPHAFALHNFFKESHLGIINWKNSVATHTYSRFGGVPEIMGPDDLLGNLTSYKELLLTIYENRTLPPEDPAFSDRIDPLGPLPDYVH